MTPSSEIGASNRVVTFADGHAQDAFTQEVGMEVSTNVPTNDAQPRDSSTEEIADFKVSLLSDDPVDIIVDPPVHD